MRSLDFIFKCTLSVFLVFGGYPMVKAQDATRYEDPLKVLTEFVDFLRELQAQLDKKHFDLEELTAFLEYDAERIITYVKQNIAFQQYRGLLRGPKGTLVGGSGNSLDQSVLLAKLLKDAGYDARVVRGVLEGSQAELLLESTEKGRQVDSPFGDFDRVSTVVQKYGKRLGFDPEPIIRSLSLNQTNEDIYSEFVAKTNSQEKFLRGRLPDHGTFSSGKVEYQDLISEAKEYFWVQYKLGSSDPWRDVHPAVKSGAFEAIDPVQFLSDEVPPELLHRFGFEVIASQGGLGEDAEHVIVPKWERPTANLSDAHLTFNFHSRHLSSQAKRGEQLTAPADGRDVLTPLFNDEPVGKAIDLFGNPIDLEAASSQFAGVFQQVQEKTYEAVSALSRITATGESSQQNPMYLKDLRIVFYLTAPGGQVTQLSRTLFTDDGTGLTDPASRERQFERLTRIHSLGILTGMHNQAAVAHQSLSTMIANFDYLVVFARALRGEKIVELPRNELPAHPWKWAGLDFMSSLFDGVPTKQHHVLYRPEPNVYMHSRSIGVGNKLIESVDIIRNTRRAIDVEENAVPLGLLMKAGIWDTVTEGALIGGLKAERYEVVDVFEKAEQAGIDSLTITPDDADALDALEISDFAKSKLRSEMREGFTIVIPKRAPFPDQERFGWWRVNAQTGSTLGMMVRGTHYGGMELTEETILLIVAITGLLVMVGGIFAYASCGEDDTSCKWCNGAQAILGAAGIVGYFSVPLGLFIGFVAAVAGLVCSVGGFLDWDPPGLTPDIE